MVRLSLHRVRVRFKELIEFIVGTSFVVEIRLFESSATFLKVVRFQNLSDKRSTHFPRLSWVKIRSAVRTLVGYAISTSSSVLYPSPSSSFSFDLDSWNMSKSLHILFLNLRMFDPWLNWNNSRLEGSIFRLKAGHERNYGTRFTKLQDLNPGAFDCSTALV